MVLDILLNIVYFFDYRWLKYMFLFSAMKEERRLPLRG